ncbi:MAG: PTS sugar transporter subunit IIA, partial [Spirochaetota bacterium]
MILSENLNSLNVLINAEAKNRWDIIKELVSLAAKNSFIPGSAEASISQALIEREKSMSTGIGKGVAIPHCTVADINDLVIMMAVNEKGINFDAIDSLPVRI